MPRGYLRDGEKFIKKRRFRSRWHKILVGLSSAVVFCTTYALILPAITMEGQCRLPEHTHEEGCYSLETVRVLSCDVPVHSHASACFDGEGELVCGYADFLVHTHSDSCCDEEGQLVCFLPEIREHRHGADCYRLWEHTHGEDCYTYTRGSLICEQEEIPAHIHSGECSGVVVELACGLEETQGHSHSGDCFRMVEELVCGLEESEEHTHGQDCRESRRENLCGLAEVEPHTHTEECYQERQLICALEETEGHTHGDGCYEWEQTLICDTPQEEWVAVCGQKEIILHTHDAWVDPEHPGCYDETGTWLICGQPEICAHFHDESCFREEQRQVLSCTLEEHTHSPECQPSGTIEYFCGREPHTHGEGCLDEEGNLTCTLEEHTHTEACQIPEETESGDYICGKEEHTHGEDCLDEEGNLTCALEEHTHQEGCLAQELPQEEQARVDDLITAIDALPGNEEISQALAAFETAEDWEGYDGYLAELVSRALSVYAAYEDMEPALRNGVTNAQKLTDLAWLWSAATLEIKDTLAVRQVNAYSVAETVMVFGGSVRQKLGTGMGFTYWDAVFVEKKNGRLYVEKYVTADGSKLDFAPSDGGFLLLLYQTTVNAAVGDEVQVNFDYTSAAGYNASGHGTVTFGKNLTAKEEKDNSEKLSEVSGADTRNLIEVNLYDYNSSINGPYSGNSNYPGFQQDNGTTELVSSLGISSFNFGNNITADLAAGKSSVTNQGGDINKTTNHANSPISGAMKATLQDGYPALADGTSLKYLFSNSGYASKQNSRSINGLFQHNSATGAYTFNSRLNHAQFNPGADTFTLYKQIISSNFMMYPFGNFLPFNDIVHQSAQASGIDREYLQSIADSAQYKYNNGAGKEYSTLAEKLNIFVGLMDAEYSAGWGAAECATKYFEVAKIGKEFSTEDLTNIYSIDYDEPTDFYFGMEMKMNFMQPHGGLTGNDGRQPMVFYFTGDDDVWVYVDGVLFLDLSGIHRHVGGEIDFVKGLVKYYSLDVGTGDVSGTPYKTVSFSELVGADRLNEAGIFKDYTTHSFNFYYMERGAGSGVCRMNFNFPLLHKNSISVSKALSVDDSGKRALLGSPDFRFQALREDGQALFIAPGTEYKIMDATGAHIGTGTTDSDGVFKLKAGQTAVFSGIQENAGRYFVRELLDASAFDQYGKVTVDGTSATTNYDVTIGGDAFKGVDSPVKDVADGSTIFHFNNQVAFHKTGSLAIQKTLDLYQGTPDPGSFRFRVTLDGSPIPVGTAYTVDGEPRAVEEAGIIPLNKDETAELLGILAGTPYTVEEITTEGYWVTYSRNGQPQPGPVSGTIGVESRVAVTVNNSEKGTFVDIPVEKTLLSPNGKEHTFSFRFVRVTDRDGLTETGEAQTVDVTITDRPVGTKFHVEYPRRTLDQLPATFYYKVTEEVGKADWGTIYDRATYVVAVTVTEEPNAISAAITGVWKDGQTVPDAKLCFVNKLDSYELPATGGPGTTSYIAGGAVLMAAAAILLYYHLKRRREDRRSF